MGEGDGHRYNRAGLPLSISLWCQRKKNKSVSVASCSGAKPCTSIYSRRVLGNIPGVVGPLTSQPPCPAGGTSQAPFISVDCRCVSQTKSTYS